MVFSYSSRAFSSLDPKTSAVAFLSQVGTEQVITVSQEMLGSSCEHCAWTMKKA